MNVTTWHQYFDILSDKYGSPYLTNAEKDILFNRSQFNVIDKVLAMPDIQRQEELLRNNLKIATTTSSIAGVVLNTTIDGLISGLTYKIRRVTDANGIEIRYSSTNKNRKNTFKAPSASVPRYTYNNGGIIVLPAATYSLLITVVSEPTAVAYGGASSGLPEELHNDVIATAIDLAGIATRDEALAQLNQMNK